VGELGGGLGLPQEPPASVFAERRQQGLDAGPGAGKPDAVRVEVDRDRGPGVAPGRIAAFAAGISPSVDSTAGERERGSLEPLLINPVSTLAVATGKWMAAAVFAAAALSVSLVLVLALLVKLPLGDLGVYFRIEPWQVGGLLAAALPVALLAPAFQMLVACYARSFKEAQTYLGYVMMIPMIPTIVMMGMGVERSPWMNLVPIVAQTQLIQSFLAAEMPAAWELAVSGGMALALSIVCVYGVARLLRREKIVFGR